tara:strand:- start:1287 stop:1661 length:375 start_codon:yes stop_codon:yes gene_type:complete
MELGRRAGRERRSGNEDRRTLIDRRVRSVPVEVDRRKGPRRVSEMENSAESQLPDWLDSTLAEAQKRADESPALAPPPIMAEDGVNRFFQEYTEEPKFGWFDISLIIFVILLFFIFILVLIVEF